MISRDVARAIFKMVRRDKDKLDEESSISKLEERSDYSDDHDSEEKSAVHSKKKRKKHHRHHSKKDKKHKKRKHKSRSRSKSREKVNHSSSENEELIDSRVTEKRHEVHGEQNELKEHESSDNKTSNKEYQELPFEKSKIPSEVTDENQQINSLLSLSRRSGSNASSRSRSLSIERTKPVSENSQETITKASAPSKVNNKAMRISRSLSPKDRASKRSVSRSRSVERKRSRQRSRSRERGRRKSSSSERSSRSRDGNKGRRKARLPSPRRSSFRRSRSRSRSYSHRRRSRTRSPKQHSRRRTPDRSKSKRSHSRSLSQSPYRSRRRHSRSPSSSPHYRRSSYAYSRRHKSRKDRSYRSDRYSRSRSRDRRSRYRHSKSRSRSRSPRRRESRKSSPLKKESKLSEHSININANLPATGSNNTENGNSGGVNSSLQQNKAVKVSGGKTIAELTEFCKKLAEEKSDANKGFTGNGDKSDDKEESTVSHPFLVKPAPEIVIPKVILPVRHFTESDNNKPLQEKFPVSCGDKHREKEMNAGGDDTVKGVDGTLPTATTVFNEQPTEKIDISSMVVKRAEAQRRLDSNPNDIEAMLILQEVQMKMSNWCQSNVKPGQFTGQLVKSLLPKDTLQGGIQAWARKDMFQNLRPVTEGIGMKLLQKMGWKPGQVIGKRGEGYVEPIAVTVKVDRKGLISQGHEKAGGKRLQITDVQGKHPVSALSEFCSKRRWALPDYNIVFDHGPAHSKQFLYKVSVNGVDYQPAVVSGNKKHAKAQAAAAALKGLGLLPEDAQV